MKIFIEINAFACPPYLLIFVALMLCFASRLCGAYGTDSQVLSKQEFGTFKAELFEVPGIFRRDGLPDFVSRYFVDEGVERNLQTPFGGVYEPLRIKFDTRPILALKSQNAILDERIDNIVENILVEAAAVWSQHLSVRPVRSPIVVNRNMCGREYMDVLQEDVAFSNTDLVILVGGDLRGICGDSTLAYAGPCALSEDTDRPILGTIDFCLNSGDISFEREIFGEKLSSFYGPWTDAIFREEHLILPLVDITVHEIGHILGQTSFLFLFFRDESGRPRTPRDPSTGFPAVSTQRCGNGTEITGVLPSENTVKVVGYTDGRFEHYLITPRVRTVARNHFHCENLEGGRLDDDDGPCIGSHWHERHWYGSLLGPIASASSENILSPITLALMEDSGWYKVDYHGVNMPAFGNGAGCEFVEKDCINRTSEEVPDWVVDEFCTAPIETMDGGFTPETLNSVFCDPSYRSWVVCDLSSLRQIEPSERTYFSDPNLAPLFFGAADYCPIPHIGLGLNCQIDDDYNEFYRGESVGENSRCLNAFHESTSGKAHRPACMQIICDAEAGVVRVGQGEFEQNCTEDGELLHAVTGESDAYIVCPRLAAVCPEMFNCPDGCFGRGDCVVPDDGKPFCQCFDESNADPSCAPPNLTEQGQPTPSPVPASVYTKGPGLLLPTEAPSLQNLETPSPATKTSSPQTDGPGGKQGGTESTSGDGSACSPRALIWVVGCIAVLSACSIETLA